MTLSPWSVQRSAPARPSECGSSGSSSLDRGRQGGFYRRPPASGILDTVRPVPDQAPGVLEAARRLVDIGRHIQMCRVGKLSYVAGAELPKRYLS